MDDIVEFLPYQGSMDEFYDSIDCMVVPSQLETFGLVVLEAMAHKRVAIVGSRCGASEIIKDGENGFVFDMSEDSAYELFFKMKQLCINPSDIYKVAQNGYELAKQYSWKNTYKQFMENLNAFDTSEPELDEEQKEEV